MSELTENQIPVNRANRPMFNEDGTAIPIEDRGEPFPKKRGRKPKIVGDDTQEISIETQSEVKVWASLGITLNTGNYENQKLDIGVTGIPVDATDEYIEEQMIKATGTLNRVVEHLAKEMGRRLKEDYGR
jgi:hypothetical protein